MTKKLIYVSTSILPSTQANGVHVTKMCAALSRAGYEVTLLGAMCPKDRKINVYEYYGVENTFEMIRKKTGYFKGATFLLSMRYIPLLKKLSRQKDLIFYGRDVIGLSQLTRFGCDVIYETHELPEKTLRMKAERRLIESGRVEKIVFISNALKNAYLQRYAGKMENIQLVVAPDGADQQPNFADCYHLSGQFDFNCCYIGGHYKGRGLHLMTEVAQCLPRVGFHLFGCKPEDVGPLNAQAGENVFYYSYVPPAQTYQVRNASDVLLMPYEKKVSVARSVSDTSAWMSPMKLFEYMASRKPIISSDHNVLQEVLEHKRNCLLCESDNVQQWVSALTSLQSDPKLRESISLNAYQDLMTHYTWDKRICRIFSQHVLISS